MTIIEFITARLDEREAAARAVLDLHYGEGRWRWRDTLVDKVALVDERGVTMVSTKHDGPTWMVCDHIALNDPAYVLADIAAKRRLVARETAPIQLGEWTPDCGGDWCLNGPRYFANYWPDNTVSASIYANDDHEDPGDQIAESGIMAGDSRADCQAKAERWIREHLVMANVTLRILAAPFGLHPDFDPEWRLSGL